MEHCLRLTALGMLSGVAGTGLGGLICAFCRLPSDRALSVLLELSAGLMTGVSVFSIIPDAAAASGPWTAVLGALGGIAFAMLLQDRLKFSSRAFLSPDQSSRNTGVLVALGVAAHNFPEGVAIGVGFCASRALGISMLLTILLHDIPEGLAMGLPLRRGGAGRGAAIAVTMLSGVPTGLGALVGAYMGHISDTMIGLMLAVAGGTMLYISVGDLVPESKSMYTGRLPGVGNIIGLMAGLILSILI